MRTIFWEIPAAVAAGTPFAPPAAAGAGRIIGVQNALIVPATSGATTNPIMEAGIASGAGSGANGAPGPGQITTIVASQQLVAGDALPVSGAVIALVYEDGDLPQN